MASHQHKMPPADSWKAPQDKGDEARDSYVKGVKQENWGVGFPAADGIVSYFATQDPHTYHFNSASTITQIYKQFIHTMIDATQYAFNLWKPTLMFQNIKINGPVAIGSKGCLKTTADFFNLFKSFPGHAAISGGKFFNDWRDAVGKGVSECLKKYVDGVTVTGFPWYPAFAAFPGPMAAPMPNVTWPLIACTSSGLKDITDPNALKKAMEKNLSSGLKDKSNDKIYASIFEAIATSLSLGFLMWVSTQMVNLVMGTGNIPSFAPPVMPAGPVVNGQNIPAPGNLMA